MNRLFVFVTIALMLGACTKKNPCDPVAQPAPHYGEKDGKCYGSCGAIGGTVASDQRCDAQGLADAGIAYDVAYCCKEKTIDPTPTPSPEPTATPIPPKDETPPDNASGPGRAPPNELATAHRINDENPGLIRICKPFGTITPANEYLILVVRELQKKNKRWGFMKKSGGRIPRDILAYAWGSEREGTHNFFVIDFVIAGCNNTPSDPFFADPAPDARPGWQLTNLETATADNGVWSFDY